ncbi:MAG: AAA family ATPase, partial [Cystobacter sp.]
MVKLKWLEVNKFRSVKPGTRLTFNEGHNVLLGQNGTGKTTLLNLIAAAIKLDFTDFRSEEFDVSYELVSSDASASMTARNEVRATPVLSALDGIVKKHSAMLASVGGGRSFAYSLAAMVCSRSGDVQVEIHADEKSGSYQRVDKAGPVVVVKEQHVDPWSVLISALVQSYEDDSPDGQPSSYSIEVFEMFLNLLSEFITGR